MLIKYKKKRISGSSYFFLKQTLPRIHVECLEGNELKYELGIRGLFKSSDNYYRRRQILSKELNKEHNSQDPIAHISTYTVDKDVEEIKHSYDILSEIYTTDRECTSENIKQIETLLVHLNDRILKVKDKQIDPQLKPIRERLMHIHDEVVQFYANENTKANKEKANKSPPPEKSTGTTSKQ